MKKAKQYLEEAIEIDDNHGSPWYENGIYDGYDEPILKAIKQAQIDAIDETVKRCAEEANLLINNLSSTDKEYNDYYKCGDDEISVNRLSILQVANKLKKELDEKINNNN